MVYSGLQVLCRAYPHTQAHATVLLFYVYVLFYAA